MAISLKDLSLAFERFSIENLRERPLRAKCHIRAHRGRGARLGTLEHFPDKRHNTQQFFCVLR